MYDQMTLENGLRIIGERMPHFQSVSIGLWIGSGSQYETREENGISHFIEHMLFKGTSKRTAKKIAEIMDAVGGQSNAFTSRECTCVYARVTKNQLPLAMDVLVDQVRNSLFSQTDMDRERGVIMEEISMAEDMPDDLVTDLIMIAQYGDQPLARPILGTEETVAGFDRNKLLSYYTAMYRPDNCVLAIAGNYDWDEVTSLAGQLLGDWKNPEGSLPVYHSLPEVNSVVARNKDIEQLHLCLGYPGFCAEDKQIYPFMLLNSVYGGAMSSRLVQNIREERGLAYSVCSYTSAFKDTGALTVYAGISPDNKDLVLNLIQEETLKLCRDGITEEEFRQAKEQMRDSYLLSMDSCSNRMQSMGRRLLLLGDTLTDEKELALIENITFDEVNTLAGKILSVQPVKAFVGPDVEKQA